MASNARHAVARSTGATTWARKEDDEWRITCLNHGSHSTAPNRSKAWVTSSHPQDWCPKCKAIAAGKAARLEEGRLDIPASKPGRKAAGRKPAAEPTPSTKGAVKPDAKAEAA